MDKDKLLLEFEEWDMEKWEPFVNFISENVIHYDRSGKYFTFNMFESGSCGFSFFLKIPTTYKTGALSIYFRNEKIGGSDVEIGGKTTDPLDESRRKIRFYLNVKMGDLSEHDIHFLNQISLSVKSVEMAILNLKD